MGDSTGEKGKPSHGLCHIAPKLCPDKTLPIVFSPTLDAVLRGSEINVWKTTSTQDDEKTGNYVI